MHLYVNQMTNTATEASANGAITAPYLRPLRMPSVKAVLGCGESFLLFMWW